jgi:hypothetical protein
VEKTLTVTVNIELSSVGQDEINRLKKSYGVTKLDDLARQIGWTLCNEINMTDFSAAASFMSSTDIDDLGDENIFCDVSSSVRYAKFQ